MQYTNFINYSTYSKGLGFIKIEDLVKLQDHYESSHVVLTDHMTCMGYPELENKCLEYNKKPIFGLSINIENETGQLVLIAQNSEGVANIKKIVSEQKNPNKSDSFITWETLNNYSSSIIAIDDFENSIGSQNKKEYKDKLKEVFKTKIVSAKDPRKNENINKKAVIDSYPIRALKKDHVILLQQKRELIKDYRDNKELNKISDKDYPFSPGELFLIDKNLLNIEKIINKISSHTNFKAPEFPVVTDKKLKEVLEKKWNIFKKQINKKDVKEYKDRLIKEVKIIEEMNFENYFLTIGAMAEFSKENEIPHVIRGSGSSSLVGYLLNISNVDPIKNNLLFERFLNATRAKQGELPDIDFDSSEPDAVVNYLKNEIGEKNISTVSTISSIKKWEISINNVIKAFPERNFEYFKKEIQKQLYSNYKLKNETITEVINQTVLKSLYKENKNFKDLIDLSRAMEGQVLNTKRGPSSYVLSNRELKGEVALIPDENGYTGNFIELTKPDVEKSGFIKMDILSNHHLGYNQKAYKSIGKENLLIADSYSDSPTFELFKKGHLSGIYQMTQIGKNISENFRPENFSDLIALQAVIRPGVPESDINLLIENKKTNAHEKYKNPIIKEILSETYGVLIYEEQLMSIAQKIGGLSPDESDSFRRSIKKKDLDKVEEYAKQVCRNGVDKNKITTQQGLNLYNLMKSKVNGYMFNKAHAIVYADITYKEAYIKAHHPGEFITHYIDTKTKNKDLKEDYIHELLQRNIVFNGPYINKISDEYKTEYVYHEQGGNKKKTMLINPALKPIIGHELSSLILKERLNNGSYKGFYDFVERFYSAYLMNKESDVFDAIMNTSIIKNTLPILKKSTKNLVASGLFDEFSNAKNKKEIVNFRNNCIDSIDNAFDLAQKPYLQKDFEYTQKEENTLTAEDFEVYEKNNWGISPLSILKNDIKKNKNVI